MFCLSVQAYLNKPLAFHMMDDWPSTISESGLFKKYWQKKIDLELRGLFDKATVLISISDEMAYEYQRRYNKNFITFHNPINVNFWNKYQRTNYDINDNPTILYAGRIGLGIDSSLELFAKAVQKVNEEQDISVKFILQTRDKPLWIEKYKNTIHKDFVSYNDLPKSFSEADFLLLPYDFSPKSIKYIKYSMPTKAPEYMISGTPIIIFAPEVTAIVKYALEHNFAQLITQKSIIEISKAIKHLIDDKVHREQIAQNAIHIAEKNHNSNLVANNFKKVILSLVEG